MWYIPGMSNEPQLGQQKAHPARHLFSIAGLSVFSVLILASFFLAAFQLRSLIENNQLAAVVTATLVELANDDRNTENLKALSVNPVLVAAAQAKADDMAAKGYFAHTSPDGRTSWSWFKDAGYSFSYAGENLAVNFSDSEDVEEAWMNSPTHRANIMNGKFTEIGIATAVGEYKGKRTTFVVQMFGTPSAKAATVAPTPVTSPSAPEDIAIATTEPQAMVVREELPAPSENAPAAASIETTAEPLPAEEVTAPAETSGNVLGFFATSPENLLRLIYIVCALVVLGALALTTELEFKKHHIRHVAAAVFLIALMGGLFFIADRLVFTAPLIG